MKIGIFGGTFNPPHNTHVALAREAIAQLGLDRLIVVPCGDPPHKQCDVSAQVRLQLARAAFGNFAQVDDYEINKESKSYTAETLAHYRQLYPDAKLYLIIGGDSVRDFGKWYCPERIVGMCTVAAVCRDDEESLEQPLRQLREVYGADAVTLTFSPTQLSSTDIRLRYEFGMDNGSLVPAEVDNYVFIHKLYSKYSAMIQTLKKYLIPQRFNHTFYVVKRGQELARDELKDKAFLACLLHDVAKYIPQQDYICYGFEQGDLPDSVVHSFLGSHVARQDFDIEDEEILNAIAYHTTGRPDMTELEKIVYVADKTEDSRPYPLEHLKQGSLDEQFVACLKEAYRVCLKRHCDSLCPLSELTVRWYCAADFGLEPLTAEDLQQEINKIRRKTT